MDIPVSPKNNLPADFYLEDNFKDIEKFAKVCFFFKIFLSQLQSDIHAKKTRFHQKHKIQIIFNPSIIELHRKKNNNSKTSLLMNLSAK